MCNDSQVEDVEVLLRSGEKVTRRIDKCIAGLVRELNGLGIKTNSPSCCNHGDGDGYIYIDKKYFEVGPAEMESTIKLIIPRRPINEKVEAR